MAVAPRTEGEAAGKRQARAERKDHFVWADEIAALLVEYQNDRKQYVDFDAFVPRIAEALDAIAAKSKAEADRAPRLVSMTPANGASDVDPAMTELVITFDRPMRDQSWSVVGNPADTPKVTGFVGGGDRPTPISESDVAKNNLPADLDRPLGVPAAYTDHAKLMLDLQVLAFQGDITRVITFQLARETSNRTYAAETGVADPHHPLSHHGNDPEKIARMAKINAFHVSLFAYYLERLKATPDGEGTLLDHTMLLYGSGIGNPNVHDHTNLPTLVAGGRAFGIKGNRHLRYKAPVPLANLHLTLLDKAGVKIDSFADSTGANADI